MAALVPPRAVVCDPSVPIPMTVPSNRSVGAVKFLVWGGAVPATLTVAIQVRHLVAEGHPHVTSLQGLHVQAKIVN